MMKMFSVVLILIVLLNNALAQYNFTHDVVFEYEYERVRFRRQGTEGKCILPPFPSNGKYTVTGVDNVKPGTTLPAAQLVVQCSSGYQPVGAETIYCVNGEWSNDIPTCVLACRLDPHPSVTYSCYRSGSGDDDDFRKCKVYEPSGTIVKPQCNSPNYYYSGALSYMRCIDGRWNYVAVCQPECGKVTPDGKPLIIEGRKAKRGEFPWHAGIYLKTSNPYKLICGGSILSSSIVISAAHCFWHSEHVRKPSEVAIAVGKVYRGWNNPMDDEAQKFDVTNIKIPARYQDARSNFQDDVAILTLSALIVYRPYVRPVCIDFDEIFNRHQLKEGSIGKVAGWGLQDTDGTPSPVLKVLEMPYVRVERCIDEAPASFRPFITSDKICAGYNNGSTLCRGDSGGGLVFPALDHGAERYYLRGLVSTAPDSSDACNAFARTSFTHVIQHKTFIEENTILFETPTVVQQEAVPLCVLPTFPENGRYEVDDIIGASPGQSYFTAQVRVKCDDGYTPDRNVSTSCSYGRWSGDLPKCVVIGCKLPNNPKLRYRCFNKQAEQWPCKDVEPNNTYALVDCAVGYRSSEPGARDVMRCDGVWRLNGNAATVECTRECGSIVPGGSESPWTAAIFRSERKSLLCGGTIVSRKNIITAAHCLWNISTNIPEKPAEFEVLVGTKHPIWGDPRDRDHTQTSKVASLKVADSFYGLATNYGGDMAVLTLETPLELTSWVQPACLDFDAQAERLDYKGGFGMTATWGVINDRDEIDQDGAELKTAIVSHLDTRPCIERAADKRRAEFVTVDKQCFVINEGRGSCVGDSGIGVVYLRNSTAGAQYVLRGIVSISLGSTNRCSMADPFGATHIQKYRDFLRENGLGS